MKHCYVQEKLGTELADGQLAFSLVLLAKMVKLPTQQSSGCTDRVGWLAVVNLVLPIDST